MCIKRPFQKHSLPLDGHFSPINKEQGSKQSIISCIEVGQEKKPLILPDVVSLLKSCARRKDLVGGIKIHDRVVNLGCLERDIYVGNALINVYAKCGELMKAQEVFDTIRAKDVVTWTTLIGAYTHHGNCEPSLALFYRMRAESLIPDAFTFVHILKACGNLGAIQKGHWLHSQVVEFCLESDLLLGNTIVDMYGNCGGFEDACKVFDELPNPDIVSWNGLVAGYAHEGDYTSSLRTLEEMELSGTTPDEYTFLSILAACTHAGLVNMGIRIFVHMCNYYAIVPEIKHYICIIDLLGRAGHIDGAFAVIKKMPCSDYAPLWGAFLGSCRKWGNIKLGRLAFDRVLQLDISRATVCPR